MKKESHDPSCTELAEPTTGAGFPEMVWSGGTDEGAPASGSRGAELAPPMGLGPGPPPMGSGAEVGNCAEGTIGTGLEGIEAGMETASVLFPMGATDKRSGDSRERPGAESGWYKERRGGPP